MQFWPKSSGCCCGGGGAPCGEICVTVRRGEDDAVAEGVTVDGGTLGTCTTDADGICCLPIAGPGTYSFVASKADYEDHPFDVVVGEGDACTGSAAVTLTPVVDTGDYCGLVTLNGCGCLLAGAVVTFTANDASWTKTRVTNLSGQAKICVPPGGVRMANWTISATDYVTQSSSVDLTGFGPGSVTAINRTLATADPTTRWCWGGHPPECRDVMPTTLTATIGGSGWKKDRTAPFGTNIDALMVGRVFTLTRDFAFANSWTDCDAIDGDGMKLLFESFKGPQCSPPPGTGSMLVTRGPIDCIGSAASTMFDGGSISGTPHCPVSMVLTDGTKTITVTE